MSANFKLRTVFSVATSFVGFDTKGADAWAHANKVITDGGEHRVTPFWARRAFLVDFNKWLAKYGEFLAIFLTKASV